MVTMAAMARVGAGLASVQVALSRAAVGDAMDCG
jgi:hypothetical protein